MGLDAPGSLMEQLEYLLRSGAPHDFAPNIGANILDEVDKFLATYIAYPDDNARRAHVLWIGHCWFMDCWLSTPRLLFISPEAGSGKTRALTVTKQLVPYADHTGDLSPAYLYRSIDECMHFHGTRPTLLYDELDTVFGPEASRGSAQMRRLIDIGHDKNATVSRLISGGRGVGVKPKKFPVYAAMALAGKMHTHEVPATIRTRSVVIQMQRRAPHEMIKRWDRRTSPAKAAGLRDLLEFWAEFVHEYADGYVPELPTEIQDRDADVWEALIAVADLAGGHWPEAARVAGVAAVAALGVNATPSRGVQLLWDIKTIFDQHQSDLILTEELLGHLRQTGEFYSWANLSSVELARLLRGYGVAPQAHRTGRGRAAPVRRGYIRGQFANVWARYPMPSALLSLLSPPATLPAPPLLPNPQPPQHPQHEAGFSDG